MNQTRIVITASQKELGQRLNDENITQTTPEASLRTR
jgi:hypothetical protein